MNRPAANRGPDPGAPSDRALVRSAAAGSGPAFDLLVRRHTKRMYRVALRIVGDPAEAEDAVQDAWISAWRSLSGFRGDAEVSTWLYRVVTTSALGHIRRRRPTVPLDTVAEDYATEPDHGPEHSALRGERVAAVLRAIATLEPSQRVPLVLHELEGLSYAQVAEVLDVEVPALHSRLRRARVSLLAKLREFR